MMRHPFHFRISNAYVAAILVVTGLAALGWGNNAMAADAPGPKIGEELPAFKLTDQNGDEHTLADLHKDSYVALVFYRSASW